jgi:hypothetical protein
MRDQTTPVGLLLAARWYGDAERKAPSACARAWGRSGLGERFLGRRARAGIEVTGCGHGAALAHGGAAPALNVVARRGVGQPSAAA